MKPASMGAMVVALTLWMGLSASCSQPDPPWPQNQTDEPDPMEGSDFVSADVLGVNNAIAEGGGNGTGNSYDVNSEFREDSNGCSTELAGHLISVSPRRGLQVLDVSNPGQPVQVGGLRLPGVSVGLHLFGDRALVLQNVPFGDDQGELTATPPSPGTGLVLLVDLSDPTAPRLVDHLLLGGRVWASRWSPGVEGGGLVAISLPGRTADTNGTHARVLSVTSDSITVTSDSDLGDDVGIVQDFGGQLVVVHFRGESRERRDVIAVLAPMAQDDGLGEGGEIDVYGGVLSVDLRGRFLRVVSGRLEGSVWAQRLEVFDLIEPSRPVRVGEVELPAGLSVSPPVYGASRVLIWRPGDEPVEAVEVAADGGVHLHTLAMPGGWIAGSVRLVLGDSRVLCVRGRRFGGWSWR